MKTANIFEVLSVREDDLIMFPKKENTHKNQTGFYINYHKQQMAAYSIGTGRLSILCDFRKIEVFDEVDEEKSIVRYNIDSDAMEALGDSFAEQIGYSKFYFDKYGHLKKRPEPKKDLLSYYTEVEENDFMNAAIEDNKKHYARQAEAKHTTRIVKETSVQLENAFKPSTWFGFNLNNDLISLFLTLGVDSRKALKIRDMGDIKDLETYTYYKDLLLEICSFTGSRQCIRFLKNSTGMENATNLLPVCDDHRLMATINDINKGYMTLLKLRKQLIQFSQCLRRPKFTTALLIRLCQVVV